MIKGKDIICIANTTWSGEYTKSTVQIMSRLAKSNRVIFIEYPFTWKDVITTILKKQKAPILQMLGLKKRLTNVTTEVDSQIYKLVMPPVIPIDYKNNNKIFQLLFKINTRIYKKQLLRSSKKLKLKSPIVITAYNPFYGLAMINQLNESLNIYYCYDGYDTERYGDIIFDIDQKFTQKTDAVITTSDFLNKEKLKFTSNSFVVKNGVDFNIFSKHSKKEISKNPQKVVGYIGSIDERFDLEVVEPAVKQLKNVHFHFTGNLRNHVVKQKLGKYSNVSFFPPVKPSEVPTLLSTYDLGIIPYIANEINKNIYPLKINEYLAVGVPIVMTKFANLPEFNEMVSIAQNANEFTEKIESEINKDNKELIKKRIEFASKNSWDSRAEEFGSLLKILLKDEYY